MAPAPFGAGGLFGGGERYPLELARALAGSEDVDAELLSFGASPGRWREPSGLVVRVLRPLARIRGHPAQPARRLGRGPGRAVVTTDHGTG